MRINLHLGIHKTATTHLQRYWALCSEGGVGIACPPLAAVRQNFTEVCKSPQTGSENPVPRAKLRANARAWLAQWENSPGPLILSDENIIGTCASVFERQSLYGTALPRLSRVADTLEGHDVRIWLSVRDYGTFLRSAYCEVMRHEPYRPFRQLFTSLQLDERGWEHLVAEIRQAFPKAELNFWSYESLQKLRPMITGQMLGVDPGTLPEPDSQRDRHSMSQTAVDLLDTIYRRVGPEDAARVGPFVSRIVAGPNLPAFDPWDDEERAHFAVSYERSIEAIRREPDVIWHE